MSTPTIGKGATETQIRSAAEKVGVSVVRLEGSPDHGWRCSLSDHSKINQFTRELFNVMVLGEIEP